MTIMFELEKETKGTFRFKEIVEEGNPKRIGTLYMQKEVFAGVAPKALTVTVTTN